MELSVSYFEILILTLITTSHSVKSNRNDREINHIRKQMLKNMGLSKVPNQKGQIETTMYQKAELIYRKSLQQTQEYNSIYQAINRKDKSRLEYRNLALTPLIINSGMRNNRWMRLNKDSTLYLKFFPKTERSDLVLVESAFLSMDLTLNRNMAAVEVSQVLSINRDGEDEVIHLEKAYLSGKDKSSMSKTLSLTSAVQDWILHPNENSGIKIVCSNCSIDSLEDLEVKLTFAKKESRSKRSYPFIPFVKEVEDDLCASQKSKKGRCCRNDMVLDLVNITGFDFIVQPKTINAYFCHGRCPHRFNPKNNHSLFQSIMHIKTKDLEADKRVPRPCCAPSKFQALDVLHVDEENPKLLKVTKWKDIIITECACV